MRSHSRLSLDGYVGDAISALVAVREGIREGRRRGSVLFPPSALFLPHRRPLIVPSARRIAARRGGDIVRDGKEVRTAVI